MSLPSPANRQGDVPSHSARYPVAEEAARRELAKILESTTFHGSETLKRFLRYTFERTLRGQGDQLKEYRLGVEVFDRPSSFDPRIDPVVRMAARRLRAKLQEYRETEGQKDQIWIDVPKGAYAANFVPNNTTVKQLMTDARPDQSARRWLALVAVLLLLAGAIAIVYWAGGSREPRTSAQPQAASIAVLPFLNLTPNQGDEYLSDGLTDELTSALSRLPGLRVVARTSAFKFKGKAEDVRTIGAQLKVDSLLEGSLQRSGERIRITVHLVRAADGYHIWSETYERSAKDMFEVEDEVSRAIAATLQIRLAAGQGPPILKESTASPEAHALYLKGRYSWNKRTTQSVQQSIEYFNEALKLDPNYASAYAALADAYTVMAVNDQAPPQQTMEKAWQAARRALQLDDSLVESYAVLAQIKLFHDRDFPGAGQLFQRGLEMDPNSAMAHQWYGLFFMWQGRFAEASRELHKAKELDPLSFMIPFDLALSDVYSRQYDQAAAEARKIIEVEPNFAFAHDVLGSALEQKHLYPEAIAEYQKYLELSNGEPEAIMRLGHVYAVSGQRELALRMLRKLEEPPKGGYVSPCYISMLYAGLGDKDRSLLWLKRAFNQRNATVILIGVEPAFDPVRSDPRFQDLIRRWGLAPQT